MIEGRCQNSNIVGCGPMAKPGLAGRSKARLGLVLGHDAGRATLYGIELSNVKG